MADLSKGLYERLISQALDEAIRLLDRDGLTAARQRLDPADSHELLTRHVAGVLQRVLRGLPEKNRLEDEATHLPHPLGADAPWTDVPLSVHGSYSLDEILAAFGEMTLAEPHRIREGTRFNRETNSVVPGPSRLGRRLRLESDVIDFEILGEPSDVELIAAGTRIRDLGRLRRLYGRAVGAR
jgi:hypothetical protein